MYLRYTDAKTLRHDQKLRSLAKVLRREATPTEQLLWQQLRSRRLGYKFRRQHALHGYIVDFYCYERMLVIEVDGGIHETKIEHDQSKDELLKLNGYKILRFLNDEVLYDMQRVLHTIKEHLTLPSPIVGEGLSNLQTPS